MRMTSIKNWLFALLFVISSGGLVATLATPVAVSAANPSCAKPLLTFPVWYEGLTVSDTNCALKSPSDMTGGLTAYIWTIVLNIIDIAIQIVGYIAVFFIIYGGFIYMTSAGSPDGAVKARKTILNAVIGLILSIAAVAIVNFIAGAIR